MLPHCLKRSVFWGLALFFWLQSGITIALANPGLDPGSKDYPVVFKEMGVVQNKAMNKQGRFLFAPAIGIDFSDGPYSMYSLGGRIGYGISDFWEVYLLAVPKFISQKRPFIRNLEEQVTEAGYTVDLSGAIARSEYGIQVLWAPLYGKDSLGISRIVRSDTFLRFGASQITYDIGSGLKFGLGIGKTFFMNRYFGLRILVEQAMTQTINQSIKEFSPITYVETGLAFYF